MVSIRNTVIESVIFYLLQCGWISENGKLFCKRAGVLKTFFCRRLYKIAKLLDNVMSAEKFRLLFSKSIHTPFHSIIIQPRLILILNVLTWNDPLFNFKKNFVEKYELVFAYCEIFTLFKITTKQLY